VADRAESIDLVVMFARRAEPSRRSSAAGALSLMDASHMLPNAKIVSLSGFEPRIERDLLSPR